MALFLTQDHMELEVSKHYFSHRFNQMFSKLYEAITMG